MTMGGRLSCSCVPVYVQFVSLKFRMKKDTKGKYSFIQKPDLRNESAKCYDNNPGKYVLGKKLGQGHFGKTYLCTNEETQEVFACKSISKKVLRAEKMGMEQVQREVEIMRHLPKHPNIVSLEAAFEDKNAVYLIMELCEGGELFDRLATKGHHTEEEAAALTRTIVEVVDFCHKHGITHRDLKLENFMFANASDDSPLKVIDFGLSMFFKSGDKFSDMAGSYTYMAPEVWERNFGPEADVWSAGVIIYSLLCGKFPFCKGSRKEIKQDVLHSDINFEFDPWPDVSESAKELVQHMLDRDPKTRYTTQQVLNHPWLQIHQTSKGEEKSLDKILL